MNRRRHVLLYTAPFCTECERARTLLERHGIAFEEIDLSADPERCCELEALTGGRSAPQVIVDGRPLGGFAELARLVGSGAFDAVGEDARFAGLPEGYHPVMIEGR